VPYNNPPSPSDGLRAVSRLLALAAGPLDGARPLQAAVAAEARDLLGVPAAVVDLRDDARPAAVVLVADGPGEPRRESVPADLMRSRELSGLFERGPESPVVLSLGEHLLVLAGEVDTDLAEAFAGAATAALARLGATEEHARHAARQSALTRAAKTLNESLDLSTLLGRICQEATVIIDADSAAIYSGSLEEGLTVRAAYGLPPEVLEWEMPEGGGLAGKVLLADAPLLAEDYAAVAELPPDSPFSSIRSCVAAPIHWGGEVRGVLSVGYRRRFAVDESHLETLAAFAELAAVAFQNASAHAGLARAARTDTLTGCLNHAALHDGLAREIERAERAGGGPLSLVLLDLDDFKAVNDEHGHLVGDEVLRRVGHALRTTTRPYDLAARYGGDEFALVAVEADEAQAAEIAARALERVSAALGDLDGVASAGATAGVAEWSTGGTASDLIARADRAMLHAKREGARGRVHAFSELPAAARPRFGRAVAHRSPVAPPEPASAPPLEWPAPGVDERLRKRTRQLALANQLGARLSAMTDVDAIIEAAVHELHGAFGFYLCCAARLRDDDIVEAAAERGEVPQDRGWSQPRDHGLIGRCLREQRPILCNDVANDPDYCTSHETVDVGSEIVVPVFVGDVLWGALDVEEIDVEAFDEEDLILVQTVADLIGSALRSASLYERLEAAYLGTAEALAVALEAKDAYTAEHARSIVDQTEAVGRALGMDEEALKDLRLGAVFHDIGKIAIPESILNKRGPLTPEERATIEQHTVIGEQILAPVEFLASVRRLVRHEHERWDGGGYPDRLAGEEIPLGSRIILACDALHAMTSDRPYRKAMSCEEAYAELRRHAGTQFDPRVVEALLEVLGA
jgi:diguanylate cyclase (GGDEF)-like protein